MPAGPGALRPTMFWHMSTQNNMANDMCTTFAGTACFFINAAMILYLISFAAPHWLEQEADETLEFYSGLWRTCEEMEPFGAGNGTTLVCGATHHMISDAWQSSWVQGTQASMCLGLICLMGSWIAVSVYTLFPQACHNLPLAFTAMCGDVAAVCFNLIGVLVYAIRLLNDRSLARTRLSWCYSVSVTSLVLSFIGLCLLFGEYAMRIRSNARGKKMDGSVTRSIVFPRGSTTTEQTAPT